MSGDQKIFTRYTGKDLNDGTVMVLGLFSDAYIDFGRYGAIIFIFIFGSFHSYILKQFLINSNKYPILILFILISFFYSIRPDNDTQTSIAHLFKSIFLIYFGFIIFKNWLILKTN
jgi:mannitol-specific phosphotransferase system IIBC component